MPVVAALVLAAAAAAAAALDRERSVFAFLAGVLLLATLADASGLFRLAAAAALRRAGGRQPRLFWAVAGLRGRRRRAARARAEGVERILRETWHLIVLEGGHAPPHVRRLIERAQAPVLLA